MERGELESRRERNLVGEVETLAAARLRELARGAMRDDPAVRETVDAVIRREVDPLSAVGVVVSSLTRADGE